ncbi:MAG: DNA primase [Gammaproteobacteria bacterium]|nr:DNA primase [Gammaproteobacteria bacterium]MCP5415935.1 DNA primase [Chromatiaceae bacterium]
MVGRIPASFIDELLNRVDIVDLISSRVPLRKGGKDFQACCPFHDEKSPSFTVSREKQFYHCFGCGAHGSAIGFLMEYDHMDFVEAVEELAAREGLQVPREAGQRQGPDLRPLYTSLARVSQFYQVQLRHHPAAASAVEYLKRRGLSREITTEFSIGFAPPGFQNLLDTARGDSDELKRLWVTGMIAESEDGKRYDRFRERIMFPIRNHRGEVIGFGGRTLGEGKPKYLNSPETPLFHKGRALYGLFEARKATRHLERLLVVEGYMDVVALAQFGIRNVVATLGTATTPAHLQLLLRAVREVVFCFDGDQAGRDAGWKALEITLPQMRDGCEVRFLFLPSGEDPDSLIRKEGAEAFNRRIAEATPLSHFLFDHLASQCDTGSAEGRVQLTERVKPLLTQLPQGLFRQMMYQQLSERVGFGLRGPIDGQSDKRTPLRLKASLHTMPPVRRAIALLASNPEFAQDTKLPGGWENLELPGIPLLQELLELLRMQPNITTGGLLERWRDRPEGRHLAKLIHSLPPLSAEGQAREFRDTLVRLSSQSIQMEWEALVAKAAGEGLEEVEKQRLNQLSKEKANLDVLRT